MGIQYVTEVVVTDVSTSHHQSFRVPSWAQQTMDRVLTVPQVLDTILSILGHTLNPNHSLVFPPWSEVAPCFDSMLVIFNGFSIYQLLSENRKRQKSPDIFIDSLTRSRNFCVSQSLAIGRGFRITRGAYLITTKQWHCPEWFCIWQHCENENVSCHSPDTLSCPCVCTQMSRRSLSMTFLMSSSMHAAAASWEQYSHIGQCLPDFSMVMDTE